MSKIKTILSTIALTGVLAFAGAAQSATVYCPNGPTGALTPPTTGRYVEVTNAANPGVCAYQDGNWDAGNPSAYSILGFSLVSKTSPTNGGTSGTWSLAAGAWSAGLDLFVGFHFGNGGGTPDSFIVQLQNGQTSGNWTFLAVSPDKVNGLSNLYIFSKPGTTSSTSSTSSTSGNIPEPNSGALALLALAMLGAGLYFRRKA